MCFTPFLRVERGNRWDESRAKISPSCARFVPKKPVRRATESCRKIFELTIAYLLLACVFRHRTRVSGMNFDEIKNVEDCRNMFTASNRDTFFGFSLKSSATRRNYSNQNSHLCRNCAELVVTDDIITPASGNTKTSLEPEVLTDFFRYHIILTADGSKTIGMNSGSLLFDTSLRCYLSTLRIPSEKMLPSLQCIYYRHACRFLHALNDIQP